MLSADPSTLVWHKSSFSESGNCVEVAIQGETGVLSGIPKTRMGGFSVSRPQHGRNSLRGYRPIALPNQTFRSAVGTTDSPPRIKGPVRNRYLPDE